METISEAAARVLSPAVLWSVFGVAFLVWAGMSAVLLYHWNMYSTGDRRAQRMKRVYFIGSVILLASAASFIFSI